MLYGRRLRPWRRKQSKDTDLANLAAISNTQVRGVKDRLREEHVEAEACLFEAHENMDDLTFVDRR
jgi:hypothetical protein